MRGLYLHLPFCKKKCHYCDFVITLKRGSKDRGVFFGALEKEIRHQAALRGRLAFDTLYFGGGTPSILEPQEMESLLEILHASFEIRPDCEFSFEMNPDDAELLKLRAFRGLGMNRVSLGVQSLNDALLKEMNRPHDSRQVVEAVSVLRQAGFENISLDLIAKLPAQTLADFEKSVRGAVDLGASQISIYDLDVHEDTVFGTRRREGRLLLPPEEIHFRMLETAETVLEEAGYEHYEITNFAKPGFQSKHNLIYWHNQEYLVLGPGAFSYLSGTRSQFAPDFRRYMEKCRAGDWTPETEDALSEENKETETLMTSLRLKEGANLRLLKLIGPSVRERAKLLVRENFLEEADGVIRLTRRGRFVAENVFVNLIEEIPKD
jgi:oxygen-independent coproporphyrinogen III oxidase